jgi:hypothetical protein
MFKQRSFQATIKELQDNKYSMTEYKDWCDEKFWPSIEEYFDDDDNFDDENSDPDELHRKCNKLRNSSKYIGTQFTTDGQVTHVLKPDMPLEEPFKTIIVDIRRRIGARPNEDSP